MNPAVAPAAVRLGKTMIMVVIMVIEAAVEAVVLKAKELFIMPYVHVVGPKLKFRSSRNRIGKFYAGIASAPEIASDNLYKITDERRGQYQGVFYCSIVNSKVILAFKDAATEQYLVWDNSMAW